MRRPNETSEAAYHKYTINIPKYLWFAVHDKTSWGTKYNNKVSPYIIDLLELDCFGVQERPATPEEVAEIEKTGKVFYPDPPRRFHGFMNGLMRNPVRYRWFMKKKASYDEAQAVK